MNALTATLDEFGFYETHLTRTDTCTAHGPYEASSCRPEIWTKCPSCLEERKAAESLQMDAKSKAAAIERWQQRIGTAGIPERFRDRTLGNYVATTDAQRKALAFAQNYVREFDHVLRSGRGAVFVGKPGTGKTHLAVGIAQQVMQLWGGAALFTTTMRALRRVKGSWARGAVESEAEAVDALVFPDLLILDEVGIQFGSDTERLILFDVLNERYEKRKPSLLLSNLSVPEVSAYLGERIFDRLREDDGEVVVFDWGSHRGTARRQGGST